MEQEQQRLTAAVEAGDVGAARTSIARGADPSAGDNAVIIRVRVL